MNLTADKNIEFQLSALLNSSVGKLKCTPNSTLNHRERVRYRESQIFLYSLERRLGVPASLYVLKEGAFNPQTGLQDPIILKIPIKLVSWDVTFIQQFQVAVRDFVSGSVFKIGDRVGIVSARCFPGDFVFKSSYYVILDDKRYNIEKAIQLDFKAGYLFFLRLTDGEPHTQLHETVAIQTISISEDVLGYPSLKASLNLKFGNARASIS